MSDGRDADATRQSAVPAPRGAELPLPPASVPAGPPDGDIADGLEETYWSVYDGAASKATVGQILARLPRIVRRIGRLAWAADRTATLAVVVLQLGTAAMTAFGLMASVAVLRELFAEGPTPDRVRASIPQLLGVVGFLAARALLEAGVAVAQARVTPKIRTALECEFLTLTAHVRLEVVDDADWHDEAYRANDRGLFYARQIVGQVVSLAAALLGLVGSAGVLGVLHPALLPLLLLSVLPVGAAAVRAARARFHSFKRWNTLQPASGTSAPTSSSATMLLASRPVTLTTCARTRSPCSPLKRQASPTCTPTRARPGSRPLSTPPPTSSPGSACSAHCSKGWARASSRCRTRT